MEMPIWYRTWSVDDFSAILGLKKQAFRLKNPERMTIL